MSLAGTPNDGTPERQAPTDRLAALRGLGLQRNNLADTINRATDSFTKLLGEVSRAVGRYGAVQLENLGRMPVFPEPIRALMGMLSRSPEALAAQLNRVLPNHTGTHDLATGQRGWVDAARSEDRALLTQLGAEIERTRGAENGPVLNRFFADLTAAIGSNDSITLAQVVEKARSVRPVTPAAPTERPATTPISTPTAPEISPFKENEQLKVGDKRTLVVPFNQEVKVQNEQGALAASTDSTAVIAGLKLSRKLNENKITIEVQAGATPGERQLQLGADKKILTIKISA